MDGFLRECIHSVLLAILSNSNKKNDNYFNQPLKKNSSKNCTINHNSNRAINLLFSIFYSNTQLSRPHSNIFFLKFWVSTFLLFLIVFFCETNVDDSCIIINGVLGVVVIDKNLKWKTISAKYYILNKISKNISYFTKFLIYSVFILISARQCS